MCNKVTLRYESSKSYNCKGHEEVWLIGYGIYIHTDKIVTGNFDEHELNDLDK